MPSARSAPRAPFEVRVSGFEGPFDLLLALIAKRRIEVTALALHEVTDDFVAHVRAQGVDWDLDEATEFLLVAATLLDLKAARLLPDGTVEDEQDVALLEARDLLFARLLAYRAYKEVSVLLAALVERAAARRPRDVPPEPWVTALLPEVRLDMSPEQFALLAMRALAAKPAPPTVSVEHVHAPAVSVAEQAAVIASRLHRVGQGSFAWLVADATSTLVIVGRFLALLELYRDGLLTFQQAGPLGELLVRWVGDTGTPINPSDSGGPASPMVSESLQPSKVPA